ncbi:MAG: hypothetical protein Q8R92_20855 [Deltaproteobacteria bacterium]|nr:hypothetical protein [Deltaproteobacteria bacterium]
MLNAFGLFSYNRSLKYGDSFKLYEKTPHRMYEKCFDRGISLKS